RSRSACSGACRPGQADPRAAPPGARELQAHRQGAAGRARQAGRAVGRIPGAAAERAPEPRAAADPRQEKEIAGVNTPGLPRRLASILYEALLLFAVAFFAAWV